MKSIANLLIEITIYSAVLFVAIIVFRATLGNRLPARMRYWLWILLVLRLVLPVTFESGVHPIQLQSEAPRQMVAADSSYTAAGAPTYMEPQQNALSQTGQPAETQKRLSWPGVYTLAITVWLTGCALMLLRLALLRWRAALKLKTNAAPVSEASLLLFEHCKKIVGVKDNIKLEAQCNLNSPAITLSLRPTLLIPDGWEPDARLEYALRHELTHYARKDHWAGIILALLRCVYWFNPFVWFAVYAIEIDMEAACDAQATDAMCTDQKKQYVRTIIELACGGTSYALNMSGRRGIEQRIRGIFMNAKAKKYVYVITVLFIVSSLAGCFTTLMKPENIYIENKVEPEIIQSAKQISPIQSQMENPGAQLMLEGFAAPEEGIIDYNGVKYVVDGWTRAAEVDILGLPIHIFFMYSDFAVYVGGEDDESDVYCLFINGYTGELYCWYTQSLLNVYRLRGVEKFKFEDIDMQKVTDAGLAYCARAYPGRKIASYSTDGAQSLFDKGSSVMADLCVEFEDGYHICVGVKAPGYTINRAIKDPYANSLPEGFSAPKGGTLDYYGVKAAVDNWAKIAGTDILGLPLHIFYFRDSEFGTFEVYAGGDNIYDSVYTLGISADSGEVIRWRNNISPVFNSEELENNLYEVDMQKAADAALAYCEKAYPGEKIAVYFTNGTFGSSGKDSDGAYRSLVSAQLSVGYVNGRTILVEVKLPEYIVWSVGPIPYEQIPPKGEVERIFSIGDNVWMDIR